MHSNSLPLGNTPLAFEDIKNLLQHHQSLSITQQAYDDIIKCRRYLDEKLDGSEELFYGINTGFGFFQDIKIDKQQLKELQNNLLKSHACGLGEEVPADIVKLMMMLKIKSLSYGYSGVSIEIVNRLVEMFNKEVWPVIYTQGSLGASGDLAPLSHLCLPLIGLGEVNHKGEKYVAQEVLNKFGWQPIELQEA